MVVTGQSSTRSSGELKFGSSQYQTIEQKSKIPQETREKVRIETKEIEEKALRHKLWYSDKIKRDIEAKLDRIEQCRQDQVEDWRAKTAKNPLRPDVYAIELKRVQAMNKRIQRENEEQQHKRLIESLKGEIDAFHDICPPDMIKAFSILDERHAMEYRRAVLESKIIVKETKILKQLNQKAIKDTLREIPQLKGV